MKVKVVWRDPDGDIHEEICDRMEGHEQIFMTDGTPIEMNSSDLFVPGHTVLEDESGLWILPDDWKISITPIE